MCGTAWITRPALSPPRRTIYDATPVVARPPRNEVTRCPLAAACAASPNKQLAVNPRTARVITHVPQTSNFRRHQ